MRIVVVGAGAVGGYFGGRLAEAGLDVSFLLRPESARALRAQGLRLRSPLGDFFLPWPRAHDGSGSQSAADVLLLACKAEHVREAAELARPVIGGGTLVIPLQNGVDAPQVLRDALGPERVLGGLSRIFAERVATGSILHLGAKPSIAFGECAGGHSERVQRVLNVLAQAGKMAVEASDDIWTEMWKKLVMVCSIGAVGAVARASLGVLLGVSATRRLLVAAGEEIASAGRAHGARIPEGYAAQQAALYERLPPETTASMHRDLERGNPSELEEQLGAACRYAETANVPTPVLNALYAALLPRELRARARLDFRDVEPRRP